MKRAARTYPAHLWQVIANDPPVDPVAVFAYTRGVPRGLAEVLLHFHTSAVLWTTGTRFEKVRKAGWGVELADASSADVDAYLSNRPDWEMRNGIWYNHVAKARALDGELIILIDYAATQAAAEALAH